MQTPEHSELCLVSSQMNTFNLSRLRFNGFCALVTDALIRPQFLVLTSKPKTHKHVSLYHNYLIHSSLFYSVAQVV